MHENQWIYRKLHIDLMKAEDDDLLDSLILLWLETTTEEQAWLRDFAARTGDPYPAAEIEDLWRLYALSRLNDMFLLRFQEYRGEDSPYAGPQLTLAQYQHIFQTLGFNVVDRFAFHPFYHEIVSVQQLPDDDAPIELVEARWPCLMLGQMLFSRAGMVVRGGRNHIRKEIAEKSVMYWTYRRRYRPYTDLSVGWGSNSQWRTEFRRDYVFHDCFLYNVDAGPDWLLDLTDPMKTFNEMIVPLDTGKINIQRAAGSVPGASCEDRIELLRNRCFILCELQEAELWPYRDFYREERG